MSVTAMGRVLAAAEDLKTLAERLVGQTKSLAECGAKEGVGEDHSLPQFARWPTPQTRNLLRRGRGARRIIRPRGVRWRRPATQPSSEIAAYRRPFPAASF